MIWALRWSVALRTFYRQILSLLYSSFPFGNFRPRLVRALLVLCIVDIYTCFLSQESLWSLSVYFVVYTCLLYIHLLMDIKHICIHHVGLVYHTWHMISKLHMGRTRKNDETHDFQFLACFALLARWLTCVQFLSNAAFIHVSLSAKWLHPG